MLTENDFKKIEKSAVSLYEQLELDIIEQIAKRIANVGYANTVVLDNIEIANEMGLLNQEIIDLVASYNNMTSDEVRKIFEEAGISALKYDDKIYKKAGKVVNPIKDNPKIMQLLETTAKRTSNNLANLAMTTANTSQIQFYNLMNKAYLEVSSGVKSSSQAIIDSVKELSKTGAVIQYPSGTTRSIESAVRTNVVTSVNQNCAKLQELRAEEMGWDLVEVSAHGGARPEHADWQGKVYSLRGETKGYKTLEEGCDYGDILGLCGVNCRHTFFPYYNGSTRTYSNRELAEIKNDTVEYDGKQISKYTASQIQRGYERAIRQDKKDIRALETLATNVKDEETMTETKEELQRAKDNMLKHNRNFNDFLKQTQLNKDNSRLVI